MRLLPLQVRELAAAEAGVGYAKLEIEMPDETKPKSDSDEIRLRAGTVLQPPVTLEDLRRDRVHDPEGAGEFIALIREGRKGRVRPDKQ